MAALGDVGGAEYYSPIEREPNEPVFHARWEARTFGISSILLALFDGNADTFRRAMEQLSREAYMSGYYLLLVLSPLAVEVPGMRSSNDGHRRGDSHPSHPQGLPVRAG